MKEETVNEVGIVGFGWVGKAMQTLFKDAVVYDPALGMGSKEEINKCHVCFVCVPTPCIEEGKLDTSIVEEVVSWCACSLIVIRSTVNPGTCDHLSVKYNKRIVMQPEFLGETTNHPMTDQKNRPFIILGGEPFNRRELINLYQSVYNASVTIRQVTLREAEIIKLTENRAIAFKVAQCQELYDVCEKDGTDYYTIREAVYRDDPRFNLWWTFVFPDKRGFNSKCIPKDIYAWCAWAESLGYEPKITRAILEKNKEWIGGNK
jgi:UDPglucose 6-dehydrogenase